MYRTATLDGVGSFDGRAFSLSGFRRIVRAIGVNAVLGVAAVVTVGVLIVAVTLAAAWIVSNTLSTNSQFHAKASMGPGALALIDRDSAAAGAGFEPKWTRAVAGAMPRVIEVPETIVTIQRVREPALTQTAKLTPARPNVVPLPRSYPAQRDVARAPSSEPAAIVAVVPPPVSAPEKPVAQQQVHNKEPVLLAADKRTAVYDISARTVYMPDGSKLEAHSGLGDKMDKPQYTKIRMRGPTPPNVYELTMRERLFHGVRAVRLNPVDEAKMFGRDGMLAHTYMLGPNGQSNGCVSFKDYRKFLQAFLDGKVDRLIVVPELGKTSWRTAVAQHSHVRRRYASNNPAAARSAW